MATGFTAAELDELELELDELLLLLPPLPVLAAGLSVAFFIDIILLIGFVFIPVFMTFIFHILFKLGGDKTIIIKVKIGGSDVSQPVEENLFLRWTGPLANLKNAYHTY